VTFSARPDIGAVGSRRRIYAALRGAVVLAVTALAISSLGGTTVPAPIWQVSFAIGKEDLRAGDAVNLTTGRDPKHLGHIRLFEAWANSPHTAMWVYEETPPRSVHRVVAYDERYQPIRLFGLSGAGATMVVPGTPAPERTSAPRPTGRATPRPTPRPTRTTPRPSARPSAAASPLATPTPTPIPTVRERD